MKVPMRVCGEIYIYRYKKVAKIFKNFVEVLQEGDNKMKFVNTL